ncbi:activity-regulated cytoskeleton associated protein 2-like [Cydia pomonella]|uniref:activity-regulated cytoskeleton associated protein 2-like n=1 Tax=Cydia pomonella TaxID=82600 RepID=UPI002ADD8556|nr:activity-regulated cytoskeleton associated protein 2-like [Cydia pomonella]
MAHISMSTEQLQQLVTSLTAAALQAATGGVKTTTVSFANVSFSYDGTRESIRLEEFLSAASVYKKVNNDMSDEAAIMSLPLVLKGEASTWWQGVKDSITCWTDFEARLRHAFAPKISGVQIFQEVFSRKQPADMLTETFIAKNRALLTQLRSPGLTEELQIDAIHGQLHINIRERIPRDSVTTFDQLLTAARNVEQVLREKSSSVSSTGQSENQTGLSKKKQRCDYCRATGHTVEECRKRLKQMSGQTGQGPGPDVTGTRSDGTRCKTTMCTDIFY